MLSFVEEPRLNFINHEEKDKDLKSDTVDFRKLIRKLTPITLNRFEIHDGQVHCTDIAANPKVDLSQTQINMTVTNLTNVKKKDVVFPAHVQMKFKKDYWQLMKRNANKT